CILVYFVAWLLGQAVSWTGQGVDVALRAGGGDPFSALAVQLVFMLAEILLGIFLASGHDVYFMRTAKGELVEFSLLFSGMSIFGRRLLLFLLGLVFVVMVMGVPTFAVAFAVSAAA